MDKAENEIFTITFNSNSIEIEQVSIPGQVFFKVGLTTVKNLVILRTKNYEGAKFWTSVPEGNQKLAEQIGPLIEQYYLNNKK